MKNSFARSSLTYWNKKAEINNCRRIEPATVHEGYKVMRRGRPQPGDDVGKDIYTSRALHGGKRLHRNTHGNDELHIVISKT